MSAAAPPPEPARTDEGIDVGERLIHELARERLFGRCELPRVGRFRLEQALGMGGMGRVFVAVDPELHRKVAIKLVKAAGADAAQLRARMQQEARAQAQLCHPNIVTVYDSGPFQDGIYIAMELVEGPNLREWLQVETRSWREIVGKFVQAGHGLAAAHRRGLVHRDFKTDNVLLDREDERPRVADFGVARMMQLPETHFATTGTTAVRDERLTQTSVGVGTPRYMSPEQRDGNDVDARSDQYSFALALWEALGGELEPRQRPPAPARLVRILERALRVDPSQRYPDMPSMLRALERRLASQRLTRVVLATAGVGAVVAASFAQPKCEEASISPQWDADTATKLAALTAEADDVPDASVLHAALQEYAVSWKHATERSCLLQTQRDERLAALSTACLEQRRQSFSWLLDQMLGSDPELRRYGLHLAYMLPPMQQCNDERFLDQRTADGNASVEDLWIAHWQLLVDIANLPIAADDEPPSVRIPTLEQQLGSVADAGEQIGDPALVARARYLLGRLRLFAGDNPAALAAFEASATLADATGDALLRAQALSLSAFTLATTGGRWRQATAAAEAAGELVASSGDPSLLRAQLLMYTGVAKAHTEPEAAVSLHRSAIEALGLVLGPAHPDAISARINLADALARAGEHEAARESLERAAELCRQSLGTHHLYWAQIQGMLGLAYLRVGRGPESLPILTDALVITRRNFGTDHPRVAAALYNLAIAQARLADPRSAVANLREGLAITERVLSTEANDLLPWLHALGRAHLQLQELPEAAAVFERALALCELHGADPADFAVLRFALARALAETAPQRAALLAEQAAAFYRTSKEHAAARERVESFLRTVSPAL